MARILACGSKALRGASLVLIAGCGTEPPRTECTAQTRGAIFHGDADERFLALDSLEQAAVLSIAFSAIAQGRSPCSAVLVDASSALTAAHCIDGTSVSAIVVRGGADAAAPAFQRSVISTSTHPELDATLLRLEEPVPPEVATPLSLSPLDPALLVGGRVALGGYGITDDSRMGLRRFVSEPVVAVEVPYVVVDGVGRSGACASDSGGPALFRDAGAPVVVGILKGGDSSCVGRDRYTSSARLLPWLVVQGVEVPENGAFGSSCGGVAESGRCDSTPELSGVTWCEGGLRRGQRCAAETRCGYSASAGAFRCVRPEEDACGGIPSTGRCERRTRMWCEAGTLLVEECPTCGACSIDPREGSARCE